MKTLTAKLFIFFSLIFINKSNAQTPDTSNTQKLLEYIFQPIDKSQVPTGFLEEYGCPMLPMATFNGTLTDSNRIDMNLWRTLYLQLQTGYCQSGSNPLPTIISVNNTIKQNTGSTLPIPIPLLIGQYNTVRGDAFSSNLLSYNSSTNQVYDVQGRSQSPYQLNNLFAACPNKKETITGSESFIIPSNLIWNNTGKTISQLQIDFANGAGFQTLNIGTPVSVSYTDTGYKRWTIKATLNDNSILQCYNDYYVLKAANVGARYQSFQTVIPAWGIINPVAGVHSGATIHVNYSNLNRTNTLRKPLIVVEGYDVSTIAPSLQSDYDIAYFINRQLPEANTPSWDFNQQLDDIAGYDLVFINFIDGADGIIRNAAVVQEVINRVNANKVLDNRFGNIRQQNVVMGLSMGGLCARYALANMTKNFPGTPTETRLLITHDSPHRGANVPLGLQYMIRMMGGVQLFGYNIYDIYPDYDDAIRLLDAGATQDLLLYRSISANTFTNNTFLDGAYRTMITFGPSDPQPTYRFIATSLGSECAHPLFNPGKTFVNLGAGVSAGIYGRLLFFRVPILSYKLAAEVEAYALPATGSTNKIARVYTINNLKLFGFIDIFKQLYNNTAYAPGNHLAVDGVPGSNYPLLDVEALNQLTNLPVGAVSLYVSFPLGPFLGAYFGAYAYNQGVSYNFTFVSVGSALDVNPYTTPVFSEKYVNGVNQNYPSRSETFIAQETTTSAATTNNVHIRFTARNSRWLFNEMENLANTLNCSSECFNPYYIEGPNPICNSGTYSIPGLQRGATITWSISPSGIVNPFISGQGVTLTKTNNGIITLTATITNACNTPSTITKPNIVVGYPTPTITAQITPPGEPTSAYFTATPIPNATYNWYVSGIANNPQQSGSSNEFSWYFPCRVTRSVYCIATTTCGSATSNTITVTGECIRTYMVSPNPTSSTMTVQVVDEKGVLSKDPKEKFYELQITDKIGAVKKQFKYASGLKQTNINLSTLPSDLYFLRIWDGKIWTSMEIIKK